MQSLRNQPQKFKMIQKRAKRITAIMELSTHLKSLTEISLLLVLWMKRWTRNPCGCALEFTTQELKDPPWFSWLCEKVNTLAKLFSLLISRRYTLISGDHSIIGIQGVSKQMLKYAASLSKESIIDIHADVVKSPTKIESCSQKNVELKVKQLFVVSKSLPILPLQIEDASRLVTLKITTKSAIH